MPKQRLNESLEQLHDELARTGSIDAESRQALEHVMSDIHAALERTDAADEAKTGDDSLLEQLRSATRSFEESHPNLTAAVGRLADALSNMGI